MTEKTSVTENDVTIDDCKYEIATAGTNRWSVRDEFGTALGYFELRGKMVVPDDYGKGTHKVMQIGKLYRDALSGFVKPRRGTRMVCEIVSFETVDPENLGKIDAYRAWLKTQPGLKAAFFLHDPETNKGRSVRIWTTRERMEAFAEQKPPEGASEPESSGVEVTPLIEDL